MRMWGASGGPNTPSAQGADRRSSPLELTPCGGQVSYEQNEATTLDTYWALAG